MHGVLYRLGSTIQFWAVIDRLAMIGRPRSEKPQENEGDLATKRFWRDSIVIGIRYLLLLAITGVALWRLLWADFSWINITKFDFSQVLTLLLSFFAILLSAMFYFRATQTSNDFYNQTYQFTKDFVDRLTRIEERFGELLKGIHEDTSATRDYMQSRGEPKTILPTGTTTVPPEKSEK